MIKLIEMLIYTGTIAAVFGIVYGVIFYLPERISQSKTILRRLKSLSERSLSNGYITVFDLATEAEISPKLAKSTLDKYVQELEGEKLVSSQGEVYYVFPRGEKIFQEKTQFQLESATERKINDLQSQIIKLQDVETREDD